MYCIFYPNIISWREVHTHELQLLYGTVHTRGAERWFFLTLRLDNCSCKSKRWLPWWQILQLDLPALSWGWISYRGTMPVLSVQFTHGCFRTLNLKFSLDTDHSFLRYSPYLGRTLHCLKKLDCFPLAFTKESRDVVTACVLVYTYKGFSWSSGWHRPGRVAYNVRASSLFHVAPFAKSKH